VARRTREQLHPWRAISTLAFVVSLLGVVVGGDLVVNDHGVAGLGLFQMTLDDESTVPSGPPQPVPPDIPVTGGSGRWVVRIGALLFALGSIATYVAAGTRRNPVRDVDLDGRDL
jgi:hypothetical protein